MDIYIYNLAASLQVEVGKKEVREVTAVAISLIGTCLKGPGSQVREAGGKRHL